MCVGSSSRGNSYVLFADGKKILIEIGCPIGKILNATNFNFSNVVGVIVSHAHG
jgi:hypothetical protein